MDQSLVSACGSCGTHICLAPRRRPGKHQDATPPTHARGDRSLLSRLPSIDEPGTCFVTLLPSAPVAVLLRSGPGRLSFRPDWISSSCCQKRGRDQFGGTSVYEGVSGVR